LALGSALSQTDEGTTGGRGTWTKKVAGFAHLGLLSSMFVSLFGGDYLISPLMRHEKLHIGCYSIKFILSDTQWKCKQLPLGRVSVWGALCLSHCYD
jgi:hypothetical protein